MRWIVFVLVVFMGVWSGAVKATFKTGNDLYGYCISETTHEPIACMAYVIGVADAMETGPVMGVEACMPPSVTVEQVVDIAVKFLRENPQHRHFSASSIVAATLAKAFPCK